MVFKKITDKDLAKYIFTQGYMTGDRNSKNHSPEQFEIAWKEWMGFFVLYNNNDPVLFSGIRPFNNKYARIFDRYMVLPEYRSSGLGDYEYIKQIIHFLLDHVEDKIPFFSIERKNRRRVIYNATRSINEVLSEDKRFYVLPGMFETYPNSWQHISIKKPYTINFNFREI